MRRPALTAAVVGALAGGLVLASPAPATAAPGDPRITLRPVADSQTAEPYVLYGRLKNVGARNNKTVTLRLLVAGQWTDVATKTNRDNGRYRFTRRSPVPGRYVYQTVVSRAGVRLDASPVRAVTVEAPPPPVG